MMAEAMRAAEDSKQTGFLRNLSSLLLDRLRFGQMAGFTFGGRRNNYQILGYPQIISAWDYREKYARGGIAKAIVEAYPEATWRGGCEVYEDEDPKKDTEFEKAFKELDQHLNVWQRLQQADILAGLSTFAVLLIGAPGKVDEELPKRSTVAYLKPFSGGGGGSILNRNRTNVSSLDSIWQCPASVAEYETDVTSERFGEVKSYNIKVSNGIGQTLVKVHWSRVIHIAEGCLDDDVFGIPVLESVFNLILDLEKVTGGGAEAHWLRANQGLHIDVDKDMGLVTSNTAGAQPKSQGLSTEDRKALRQQAEDLADQMQRVMVTRGVKVNQLGSDVANFGQNADAIMKQIAGSKKIPMRLLTGSEMGTLASEQDAANFDSRVQDRRTGYAGPKIARRLIDRLIQYEILPTPKEYTISWPVEENMDEKGKAEYAKTLAATNQTQGEIVFTSDEIRDMAFDLDPLTDAERMPLTTPIHETAQVDANGNPIDQPAQQNPQQLKAALKALERAIEAEDVTAIARILQLGPHKFSTTQVQLPDSFLGFGKTIPAEDLAEAGLETDPHVTLKYGIHTNDADTVRSVLAGRGPVTLTLGKLDYFETESGDALYAEVQSEDLKRLNKVVSSELEVTDTQPSYIPHATIAYLKSGLGKKYAGMTVFENQQHVATSVTFSNADGERTVLPCSGM